MVAGDKRRRVEDTEPVDYLDLAITCEGIEEPRDSCLIALLYLSGRRICEVLQLRKRDFKIEKNRISFETLNEKTFRSKRQGNYTIPVEGKFFYFSRKTGEKIEYNTRYYEKIRPHWRIETESGKALTVFVLNRLESLPNNGFLFASTKGIKLPIGYGWAYQIIRFHLPKMWPHLLRHERFTEVARVYKSDLLKMHRFTFHHQFPSTDAYIRQLEEEEEKI